MTKEKRIKKNHDRRMAYPSISLSEAVKFIIQLRQSLGKGPYGRKDASIGLGYKGISGASATKISALVHFGLLTKSGNTYTQSDLAERITHPVSEEDKHNAISESLMVPEIYNNLITDYSGQALPTQLGNILIRKGINAKISEKVAMNFQNSLEFAGLLKNGVILSKSDLTDKESSPTGPGNESPSTSSALAGGTENKNKKHISENLMGKWDLIMRSGKAFDTDVWEKATKLMEALEKLNKNND